MQLTRTIAIALIASIASFGAVNAQSMRKDGTPSEFPPASFTGKQFVDSRGCVFIRAGIDGAVTWVPRVARDRKMICGFQPTFAGGSTPSKTAQPNTAVVQIVPDAAPVSAPVKTAQPVKIAKPKTTETVRVAKVAKPRALPAMAQAKPATVQASTRPVRKVTQVAKVAQQPTVTASNATTQQTANCGNVSAQSAKYLSHATAKVRCGPQQQISNSAIGSKPAMERRVGAKPRRVIHASANQTHETALVKPRRGQVVVEGQVSPHTRVVPRHVYESRYYTLDVSKPPAGYTTVWKDDRLNPRRAEGTFAGKAQMEQIWWHGTPRWPRWGKAIEPVVAEPKKTKIVLASKNAPAQKTMRLGHDAFVQVATYASQKDAQVVARRVRALGLPVRIGKVNRNGQMLRMVLAGPFHDAGSANAALSRTQSAGYGNARIR
ncbi:MAG: SPOR domain-containing protein [Cognatishimia sp.]